MKLLSIYNSEEEKILRQTSRPITEEDFSSGLVQKIVDLFVEYSNQYPGSVGFSAIQFRFSVNMFYINCRSTPSFPHIKIPFSAIVLNPTIISTSEETFPGYEGCMSIVDESGTPTYRWRVNRSTKIVVSYLDETGILHKNVEIIGFPAVIFQHEYDHLQGKLIDEVGFDSISQQEYIERKNNGETGLILE